MWIPRKYDETLKSLSAQFPAVAVTGARQVGKTSLVQHAFPNINYISLDLPAVAAQAEKNPDAFFRSHGLPLIIDEVQYAPSLFRYVKSIVDTDRKPGRFLLTGSQVFPLMEGLSESLAGRCGVLNIMNLSAEELHSFAGKNSFNEGAFLFSGGYPELHARPDLDRHFWYSAYLTTYLERDVRNILNVGSLRDFDRFLRAVAVRTAQILSYSDLARDVGVAPNTAKKWISVLQASGQVFLLEPYFRNISKRLVKSPKLYMCDTGLAAFLMGFENWQAVERHSAVGALWETHVVMEAVKFFASRGLNVPIWFWRTAGGDEVDLIIERDGRVTAIECKYAEVVNEASFKGLDVFTGEYGPKNIEARYVACRTPMSYSHNEGITAIPGSRLFEYLQQN
ncbi:MAG: ATP-binding protein [Syntrophaceae bacterium]|nr:ATP-binding protein [Syntrophaceae bacterium]